MFVIRTDKEEYFLLLETKECFARKHEYMTIHDVEKFSSYDEVVKQIDRVLILEVIKIIRKEFGKRFIYVRNGNQIKISDGKIVEEIPIA